jgi:hypothetical protein
MIMMKFVQGMQDDAIHAYQHMISTDTAGVNFQSIFDRFLEQGGTPPDSDAYRQFVASMYESNAMRLINYSVNYIARHIGDGFESWWAYLVGRDIHEQGLRAYTAGDVYRDGVQSMPRAHSDLVRLQAQNGSDALAGMNGMLSRTMSGEETCCLLRWLDIFDLDVLKIMRSIIHMALQILNFNAAAAFGWYKNLANYPWRVISQQILKALDSFYEKVMKRVLDSLELDGGVWSIIQACTPINELIDSVLEVMEYIRNWYHDLVGAAVQELGDFSVSMGASWEIMADVRRAREILLSLDQMIAFKQQIGDSESVGEDRLTGAISKVQGFMFRHEIPGAEGLNQVKEFTQDAVEWCRTLGDWDKIKSKLQLGDSAGAS